MLTNEPPPRTLQGVVEKHGRVFFVVCEETARTYYLCLDDAETGELIRKHYELRRNRDKALARVLKGEFLL